MLLLTLSLPKAKESTEPTLKINRDVFALYACLSRLLKHLGAQKFDTFKTATHLTLQEFQCDVLF
jgi:hypothetical protein